MSNVVRSAFSKFGSRLLDTLKNRKVEHAANTTTVSGLSSAEVLALVNKTSVGLSSLVNAPVATKTEAEASVAPDRYLTPLNSSYWLAKRLTLDSTVAGNVLGGLTPAGVNTGRLCQRLNIVSTDAELTAVQNYKESFSTVFNNWTRISHGTNGLFPSNANETTQWSYDSANDAILCTVNSSTMIGFISPDSQENFDFEVEIASSNSDDDWIGVVIAFTEADGKQYTLNLWRCWGGWNFTDCNFAIEYNQGQSDSQVLAKSNAGLAFPSPYNNVTGSLRTGWPGAGAIRLKVKREGNTITCWTTAPGAPTVYLTEYPLTVNLDSLDVLQKFKGPQRFGYFCSSQTSSSWKSLARPGDRLPIVDLRTMDSYVAQGSSWVKQPAGTHRNLLAKNRLFTNQITGKLFFVGESLDTIYPIVKGS